MMRSLGLPTFPRGMAMMHRALALQCPLKAGGLGVDVLANPDHAAVAAMSSAVASLHAFARDVDALCGRLWMVGGCC